MATMSDLGVPDYSDLGGLLSQFMPSDADKAAARKTAELQFFLGMLGAPKGTEFQAIGQSGINALNNYQKQIQFEQALRNQNIQAAIPLIKFGVQANMARNFANGGMAQQPVSNGVQPTMANSTLPAGAVGGTGMGGGTPAMFGPGSQPGPTAGPTIPTVPAGTNPTGINGYQPPNYATEMPPNVRQLIASTLDPATMAKAAEDWSTGTLGRNGLVTSKSGRVLAQVMPDQSGVLYFNPDGTPGRFVAYGQDVVNAAANRDATISGAKAGAEASAKLPYTFQSVPNSAGGTTMVPGDVAAALTRAQLPSLFPGAPTPAAPTPQANPNQLNDRGYYGQVPPAAPQTPVLGQSQTTAGKLFDENRMELSKSILADINARANAATKSQGFTTAIGNLLTEVGKTGVTTPALNTMGRIAIAAGVDPNTVKSVLGSNSAPEEALRKLISMTAGQSVKQNVSGNRPTQFEFSTFLDATPNPGMQQQAYNAALQIMHGTENSARGEQAAAQDWYQSHQGDMTGFPSWWNQTNPDTKYLPDKSQLSKIFSTPASDQSYNAKGSAAAKTVVRTGIYNGRKVVQYSDGSTAYAQ